MHHQGGQVQLDSEFIERSGNSISCPNTKTVATPTQKPSSICDDNKEISIIKLLDFPIECLPQLPKPDNDSIRRETIGGTFLVLLFIATFVSLTHGVALTAVGTVPTGSVARSVLLILIYVQSGMALMCHLGILYRNPGVIPRTMETCYPIPYTMRQWVVANQKGPPQSSYQHEMDKPTNASQRPPLLAPHRPPELYIAGDDGRVYCTRCLVWRQPGINHFHCGTCQRCVAYYDHHCTFFGRCIAGKLLHLGRKSGGNYAFFVGILVDGAIAYVTTAAALVYSFSLKYNPGYVIPVGVVAMILLPSCMMRRGPSRLCMVCRRCIVSICEIIRKQC
jgi:hypothetical protein